MGTAVTLFGLSMLAMQPAPPTLEALVPVDGDADTRLCLPDRGLCLGLSEPETGATRELLIYRGERAGVADRRLPLPYGLDSQDTLTLWTTVVRLAWDSETADGSHSLLIGVITRQDAMYSGGGGATRRLHLRQITWGQGLPFMDRGEVVSLPWQSSLMIRACFNERDSDRRRGACHDEYAFGARITLADNDGGALPALRYQTQATTYPQTARRWEDSSTSARLTSADLSHWRDPECSYTRTLHYNPATERYEMERTAPDCSSYTTP